MAHLHPTPRHQPFRMFAHAAPVMSGRGVYRVLRGSRLPCGCVAGVYELFDGATTVIVEESSDRCDAGHVPGDKASD